MRMREFLEGVMMFDEPGRLAPEFAGNKRFERIDVVIELLYRIAIVGALACAVTGFADWTSGGAHPWLGGACAVLGITFVSAAVASCVLMAAALFRWGLGDPHDPHDGEGQEE